MPFLFYFPSLWNRRACSSCVSQARGSLGVQKMLQRLRR